MYVLHVYMLLIHVLHLANILLTTPIFKPPQLNRKKVNSHKYKRNCTIIEVNFKNAVQPKIVLINFNTRIAVADIDEVHKIP